MAINAYHSGDDGVPSYNFSSTGSSAEHFQTFKTIVKACLVDGYGTRPPAGWELIAEGTNYLVLRTGTHSGYIGFEHSSATITIWLSQTFSGMDGNRMIGDGLKSGTGTNNSPPHIRRVGYLASNAASHSWTAVADERTAIFSFSGDPSSDGPVERGGYSNSSAGLLYFGEDSQGNVIACGGENRSSGTPGPGIFSEDGFTALYDPATGLLVDVGSISPRVLLGTGSVQSKTSSFYGLTDKAIFTPVEWASGGVWAKLRGLCVDARLIPFWVSNAAEALGLVGGLRYSTLNTSLPLDGAHIYWFCSPGTRTDSPNHIMTTNPEFW